MGKGDKMQKEQKTNKNSKKIRLTKIYTIFVVFLISNLIKTFAYPDFKPININATKNRPNILQASTNEVNNLNSYKIAQRTMLQGGVEHSETLEPIPNNLKSGANFNFNNLPPANTNLIWYQIPNWLGGEWQRKYVTIIDSTQPKVDPPGRKYAKQKNRYGAQVDNNGDIWDCICLPRYRTINNENQLANIQTYATKVIESNNEHVIKTAKAYEVYYDSYSNQIVKSLQYESITTITKINPKKIKINSSTKFYTDNGQPYAEDTRVSTYDKIDSYKPQNIGPNGINLRSDFQAFLNKNNLLDLIPQSQ